MPVRETIVLRIPREGWILPIAIYSRDTESTSPLLASRSTSIRLPSPALPLPSPTCSLAIASDLCRFVYTRSKVTPPPSLPKCTPSLACVPFHTGRLFARTKSLSPPSRAAVSGVPDPPRDPRNFSSTTGPAAARPPRILECGGRGAMVSLIRSGTEDPPGNGERGER